MPTAWVRTALFVNQPQTRVRYLRNQIIESFGETKVKYTGEQLNMFDNDVYLEVVRLAQDRAPGEKILFNRHSFLRALGISRGKNNYGALYQSLKKLNTNTIEFQSFKPGKSFSLIDELSWDEHIGPWFSVGNLVIEIFSKTAISYIDLEARRKLSKPLSKYLQNYMSGGAPGEQKIKVQTLMTLSGATGRLKDFLGRSLPAALNELKEAGLINFSEIKKNRDGENIAIWNRNAHPKSSRIAS